MKARLAEMSLESFEDYFYKVNCIDYAKLSAAMDRLAVMMNETDAVRITGPGTELIFSTTVNSSAKTVSLSTLL